MIYKIGICGASGRMGLEIANLMTEGFEHASHQLEFSDAIAKSDRLKSIDGIPLRKVEDSAREPVHVWIDFSRPEATLKLIQKINTALIVGTTGFTAAQVQSLRDYAKTHPVLYAPNMAPGMNALMQMLNSANLSPKLGFDVVASETHHVHKKDKPSGTLKQLLEILESQGHQNIQVQVARAGEVFGVHTLKFISDAEEITIEHRVSDRKVFAKGALLAASFLVQMQPGFYTYAEVVR